MIWKKREESGTGTTYVNKNMPMLKVVNLISCIMFAFGCEDCSQTVEENHIENAIKNFTETPKYCDPIFMKLVEEIFPNVSTAEDVQEATILYHNILTKIDRYSEE